MSESLKLARNFLGKTVTVKIDRPIGSKHPDFPESKYLCNYGFIPDTKAPDGEELDAYVLGVSEPLDSFRGSCIALIHRIDDDDDKLVVVPKGLKLSDEEIYESVNFSEKWFNSEIIR